MKEHPAHVGYAADEHGQIYSFWTKQGCTRTGVRRDCTKPPRLLHPFERKDGYWQVTLFGDGTNERHAVLVHRFVLECFLGPAPDGMECRHLNEGDKSDNSLTNLIWGTRKENSADRRTQGTHRQKLDAVKVKEIKKRLASKELPRVIASDVGVSRVMINQIRRGHAWPHVEA